MINPVKTKGNKAFTDSIPLMIYSLFAHAITLITVIYLTLLGTKLYTWYKLAMLENQCSAVITTPNMHHKTSKIMCKSYPESHHHHELEAFMGAEYLGENDVIQLIDKYCFQSNWQLTAVNAARVIVNRLIQQSKQQLKYLKLKYGISSHTITS